MAGWQWFGRIHTAVYRATGGRMGGSLAGRPMLLLTTTGRRSAAPRTTPLAYMNDGKDWVVVASNNGAPNDPAWWLNLQASPEATVQEGADLWSVHAHRASPSEHERLWPRLIAHNPPWAGYQARTSREIAVVVLERGARRQAPIEGAGE